MTFRKHTTIAEVVDVLGRHALVDVSDRVAMCRCGRWFDATQFSGHLIDEARGQLTARTPPSQTITGDVLAEVAAIHRATPDGEKIRRVAEFLGVANNSAGTYISRARKAGAAGFPDLIVAQLEVAESSRLNRYQSDRPHSWSSVPNAMLVTARSVAL